MYKLKGRKQSPFIGKRVPLIENDTPILYTRYAKVEELLQESKKGKKLKALVEEQVLNEDIKVVHPQEIKQEEISVDIPPPTDETKQDKKKKKRKHENKQDTPSDVPGVANTQEPDILPTEDVKTSGPENVKEAKKLRQTLGLVASNDEQPQAKQTAGQFSFKFSVKDQIEAETQEKLKKIMLMDTAKDGYIPKKVFVCGMPFEWDEALVREYWGYCGDIEDLDMMTFSDSSRFNGVAFITFKTEEQAETALACNGEELEGRKLRVEKCKTSALKKKSGSTPLAANGSGAGGAPAPVAGYNVAYVGNVPYEATDKDLQKLFKSCGVSKVRLHTDKVTGKSKGFAHLHFPDADSLQKAVAMDGTELLGRPIKVSYGQPKS